MNQNWESLGGGTRHSKIAGTLDVHPKSSSILESLLFWLLAHPNTEFSDTKLVWAVPINLLKQGKFMVCLPGFSHVHGMFGRRCRTWLWISWIQRTMASQLARLRPRYLWFMMLRIVLRCWKFKKPHFVRYHQRTWWDIPVINDLKYGSRTHIYRYITDEGHFWWYYNIIYIYIFIHGPCNFCGYVSTPGIIRNPCIWPMHLW